MFDDDCTLGLFVSNATLKYLLVEWILCTCVCARCLVVAVVVGVCSFKMPLNCWCFQDNPWTHAKFLVTQRNLQKEIIIPMEAGVSDDDDSGGYVISCVLKWHHRRFMLTKRLKLKCNNFFRPCTQDTITCLFSVTGACCEAHFSLKKPTVDCGFFYRHLGSYVLGDFCQCNDGVCGWKRVSDRWY